MALRTILTDEDLSLRKISRRVERFDERLHTLLDDLAETLDKAEGAGLAAPQVGVLRRVCIVCLDEEEGVIELVNPVVTRVEGEQEGPEGCLSIPGKTGLVRRPLRVWVSAQDRFGNFISLMGEGFKARAFCHEIDHLDGKLYTDIVLRFLTQEELLELTPAEEEDAEDARS